MLVEVRVQSLGMDRSNDTPVVVLRELEGERILPIWIGAAEASAIAMELAEAEFARPLTHDLLVSVLKTLGGKLERIVITRVEENTYYAELVIHRGDEVLTVDARPSDSIAVALRTDAGIFTEEELLDRVALEIAEAEEAPGPAPSGSAPDPSVSRGMTPEELEAYLRKLNPEDFGRFTP